MEALAQQQSDRIIHEPFLAACLTGQTSRARNFFRVFISGHGDASPGDQRDNYQSICLHLSPLTRLCGPSMLRCDAILLPFLSSLT